MIKIRGRRTCRASGYLSSEQVSLKAAGHPLGIELLEMVRERIQTHYRSYGWDGPLEKEISEWTALYPNDQLNLESVLAYSHRKHFLKLIGSDEYFEHGSRSSASARPIIQDILSRPIAPEAVSLYKRFAGALTPTDLVLTFNYDTVLEDTLDLLGKPYSLTPEWWLHETHDNSINDGYFARFIDILKLHGSIDWYDRKYYDDARAYYASTRVEVPDRDCLFGPNANVPTESLARGAISGGHGDAILRRVFRVPEHRKYFPFHSGSWTEVLFLLPPAYDKILGADPIRELWSNLHRTMDAFSMITIIGYSMPAYDSYAYEALGKLIIDYQAGGETTYFEQSRIPLQIITKADYEDEVIRSIPFIDSGKTRIWIDGSSLDALKWLEWIE